MTDDFVFRPTNENENLEQVLVWATTSSVLSDYKLINEDNYSLCGFHSVTRRETQKSEQKCFMCHFATVK